MFWNRSIKDKLWDWAGSSTVPAPTRPCLWGSRQILASMSATQLHMATKRRMLAIPITEKPRPLSCCSVGALTTRSLHNAEQTSGHQRTNACKSTNTHLSLQCANVLCQKCSSSNNEFKAAGVLDCVKGLFHVRHSRCRRQRPYTHIHP